MDPSDQATQPTPVGVKNACLEGQIQAMITLLGECRVNLVALETFIGQPPCVEDIAVHVSVDKGTIAFAITRRAHFNHYYFRNSSLPSYLVGYGINDLIDVMNEVFKLTFMRNPNFYQAQGGYSNV